MSSSYAKTSLFLFTIGFAGVVFITPANAQMSNNPWGFQPQNRASVAALMRQVEEGENGSSAVTQIAAQPSFTNLVCGSEGKSSASGNTTCIILNNADGNIQVGQDAEGNQTATSSATDTQTSQGGSDDILETLAGTPGS